MVPSYACSDTSLLLFTIYRQIASRTDVYQVRYVNGALQLVVFQSGGEEAKGHKCGTGLAGAGKALTLPIPYMP